MGPVATGGRAGRRLLPARLAVAGVAGVAALGGLAWFATSRTAVGAGRASDAVVVVDSGDVYLVDNVEAAAAPGREDRVLRDVVVHSPVLVAVGNDVLAYGPFGYEHDGGPLFAYSEEGDNEWRVAVIDDGEVVDIERLESAPSAIYVTGSGTYVIEHRTASCSILRLEGREARRVSRAEFCHINPVAEVAITADRRSSRSEVSFVDLASEAVTPIVDVDADALLSVAFSPTNRSVLVSGTSTTRSESLLVDLASGEVIAEDRVFGHHPTDSGFVGFDYGGSAVSLLFVGPDGTDEIARGEVVDAIPNPSATRLAVLQYDRADISVSVAPIVDGTVGELTEVGIFASVPAIEFIDDDRFVIVSDDGLVGLVTGEVLEEVGELQRSDLGSPAIQLLDRNTLMVSNEASVGVLRSSDSAFLPVDDLASAFVSGVSGNGRWAAVIGWERPTTTRQTLLLVDLVDLDYAVIDVDEGFQLTRFGGDHLYFTTGGDRPVTRRVPLSLDGRVDHVADDVTLYVPEHGHSLVGQRWDVPFVVIG